MRRHFAAGSSLEPPAVLAVTATGIIGTGGGPTAKAAVT
jgi:hypothetical protein